MTPLALIFRNLVRLMIPRSSIRIIYGLSTPARLWPFRSRLAIYGIIAPNGQLEPVQSPLKNHLEDDQDH